VCLYSGSIDVLLKSGKKVKQANSIMVHKQVQYNPVMEGKSKKSPVLVKLMDLENLQMNN
jgi:hypothetical protein